MATSLRAAQTGDDDFLFRLYSSTREGEFSALGWGQAQLEPLLRMQFAAQRQWYRAAYPESEDRIVIEDEAPIGRLLVQRLSDANVLVDIALLPEHRGRRIGEALIHDLLEESAQRGLPVRLQVLKNNPAVRLYERLGFVKTGEDQLYWRMQAEPGRAP